jgi:predicted dehydrogenase
MLQQRIGIIMNGVTGRVGAAQHLRNAICAIKNEGGILLCNGDRLVLDPILVGRNASKLKQLADECDITRWTTDLDEALANRNDTIFFDASRTSMRFSTLKKLCNQGNMFIVKSQVVLIYSRP